MITVTPKKYLGQHFLHDQGILRRFIRLLHLQPDDSVIEIGPGLGALTLHLLPQLKHLSVIEYDRDLVPLLENNVAELQTQTAERGEQGKLSVYLSDVLAFNFDSLNAPANSLRLVGNLPYGITTPLLFYLITYLDLIKDMHFMVQYEVAERMAAKPGGKTYGRLSVMLQYYCDVTQLFTVNPGAFTPPPKVLSAFVKLVPRQRMLDVNNTQQFTEIVRAAFNQRRKTVQNALKGIVSPEIFLAANIDPLQRPGTLSVDDYVRLSNAAPLNQ